MVKIVDNYFNKEFMFGGVMTKRRNIIKELEKLGATQKMIDMYLFGLDMSKG